MRSSQCPGIRLQSTTKVMPFIAMTSASAPITFVLLHLRSHRIIRHSLTCSIRFGYASLK
jgi:hypothetical protein